MMAEVESFEDVSYKYTVYTSELVILSYLIYISMHK